MSKKSLVYIAVTMCMALIGLLSVQYYWTRRIFSLNQEFFSETVHSAMQEVVAELDEGISEHLVRTGNNRRKLLRQIDTVNYRIMQLRRNYPEIVGRPGGIVWNAAGEYELTSDPVQRIEWRDTVSGVLVYGSFVTADYPAGGSRNLTEQEKQAILDHYTALQRERDDLLYANLAMTELLQASLRAAPEREMGAQLSPLRLDSLIQNSLSRRNVRTTVEWGIYSTYSSKLLVQKTGDYGVQLLQSPFNYRLFPNQEPVYPSYLFLYFPHKISFIVSQMWYLVLSSFFLFALLIYTFVYTFLSIWKQKKLTEMKSDFINHVTHEIKTPVSTISLICESFNDPDVHYDKEGLDRVLKIIQHENQRLQSLSRQIIQISKMEQGDYFLNKTHFGMHKAIEEAVNNTGFQVMHKNGRIVTHFQAENDTVEGDRTHIVHIVSNLIDNANKYCQEKPLIEIFTSNVKGGLQIDVKDNGIGIAKANLNKIFDKLYRVPTGNKHDVKGFGLGLSYVASIMKQHGGRVWVESELREGSVFHLFFPQDDLADS